jgi:drug/metabolite transporter (DMT)-like permease
LDDPPTLRTPWPLRFVLLAIAWGSTFLFIKIGDEAFAPLQVSLGRLIFGAATLICATAILAVLTALFSSAPHGVAAKQILSILALGVIGTGLTFLLNYSLIRDVGATVTSTVAYVMPIVSTVLGVAALGEPLSWYLPVGAAIVISGAVLAQSRDRRELARDVSGAG